jgi:signal transduction histidine kinase
MKAIHLFLLCILTALYLPVRSQSIPFQDRPSNPIGEDVEILSVDSFDIGIQSIIKLDKEFEESDQKVPNLGVTHKTWILKYTIKNESFEGTKFLQLAKSSIDQVTYYFPDKGSYDSLVTGIQRTIPERNIDSQHYHFKLDLAPGESKTYYLKMKSADQIQAPLYLMSGQSLQDKLSTKNVLFGIFTGIFLVMFLYNLFIFISVKDKSYLLYVVHLLAVYFTQITLTGFGFKYFWPTSPQVELYSVYLFSGLVGITVVFFFNGFLSLKKTYPKAYKITSAAIPLYIVATLLAFIGFKHLSYMMLQVIVGSVAILLIVLLIVMINRGFREARLFLLAWGIFIIGTFVFVLKDFNILPYNTLTARGMQIGSAIEVMLLSFALADRINILKKEKEQSQARALLALRENERIIKEQNVILESKVRERTEKLQKSNEELTQTLKELKSTQAQLVDAEKMASLGQLTAGIAHELNNPINFVASNVKPLERDFNDLMQILDKVDEIAAANKEDSNFAEIVKLKEELDTDYLRDEVSQLLSGVAEGAKRTAEIVRGLRIFSRLDEDSLKQANVNECLDSTIIVLKSHVRGRAKIIRNFDDDLTSIKCYPGKLNQVFMNIISNAVQATETSGKPLDERWVKVHSYQDSENIYVSISDNGCGMNEETQHKIFDPFFTTKEVGEGTGLGLSIVLGIIKDHNGNIEVNSTVNEGTEFLITLSKSVAPRL